MIRFILGRLAQGILVLYLVLTGCFFMIRLAPGGPFDGEKQVAPEIRRSLEAHYGIDQPLLRQYIDYFAHLLRGDLGPSFKHSNRTVNELIAESFPVSFELGFYALIVALTIGLVAGVVSAWRPGTVSDHAVMSLAMTGICVPAFVLGPVLLLVFSLKLNWFNSSGWELAGDRVLPAITLGAYYAAFIARLTRAGMLDVLNQDFIRTAHAKGASPKRVVVKHALRLAILPVVSYLGPAVAGVLTGSFVVETIFEIPGLGRFFVDAAFNRDYTMILGTVLFYATLLVVLNLLADVAMAWLNPRVRFD